MTTLRDSLAEWAMDLRLDLVPPDVVHATKLRILDILGAMLAGSETTLSGRMRRAAAESLDDVASLIGTRERSGLAMAALVNGTSAHVLEFDDSHIETGVHPTSPVLAAALSQAEVLNH